MAEEERRSERSPSDDSLFGGASDHGQSPSQVTLTNAANPDEKRPIDISPTPNPIYGVTWVIDGLSQHPTWTVQPTVESIIATLKIAIGRHHDYSVKLLHDGKLSRLYDVCFDNQAFVMRVCLPVCPRAKTEAEVATLSWVSQHTSLPVPRVRAYDSSQNNPLGYEWLLMTKLEGKPLTACWPAVTMGSKERIVKQIAAFSVSAFRQPFHQGIGSIIKTRSGSNGHAYGIGELVSMARGPFSQTSNWIQCRLNFASSDLNLRLDNATNADEKKALRRMLDVTIRIERLKPQFLPPHGRTPPAGRESVPGNVKMGRPVAMLVHDCLSLDNILVDDNGILTGVVDWQCIPCLPLHEACQFPAFLQQAYDRFSDPPGCLYLIDGIPYPIYTQDQKQYELTKLRQFYIREVLRHAPDFVDIWRDEANRNLRDYEAAVQNCDNEFTVGPVEEWVKAMEQGTPPTRVPKRLHELLLGYNLDNYYYGLKTHTHYGSPARGSSWYTVEQ
ncbi:phosphotransferase enzyme family-domain-containing protein [Xylaria telfairii]|nr:phosphotransferase enzyme family-domain-containing protein [Xylaria telfairii]